MLMALLNYIDRGAIAYASASILPEYGFDKADWGNVLGYFGYGYILGALIGVILADRFGAKRIWLIAGATWSVFETPRRLPVISGWRVRVVRPWPVSPPSA